MNEMLSKFEDISPNPNYTGTGKE